MSSPCAIWVEKKQHKMRPPGKPSGKRKRSQARKMVTTMRWRNGLNCTVRNKWIAYKRETDWGRDGFLFIQNVSFLKLKCSQSLSFGRFIYYPLWFGYGKLCRIYPLWFEYRKLCRIFQLWEFMETNYVVSKNWTRIMENITLRGKRQQIGEGGATTRKGAQSFTETYEVKNHEFIFV